VQKKRLKNAKSVLSGVFLMYTIISVKKAVIQKDIGKYGTRRSNTIELGQER